MSLSLTQVRSMLRKMTGNDTSTLPDADTTDPVSSDLIIGANTFMNMAWWNMLNVLEILEKQSTTTVAITTGQVSFVLGANIEAVRKISYTDPDSLQTIVLDQKDLQYYRANLDTNVGAQDKPIYYSHENQLFYLLPIPSLALTLNVDTWNILTDTDVGGITAPRETTEIIINGAAARIFSMVNANIQKAAFYRNVENGLLENYIPVKAKEEDNNPHAGIDYWGRDYDQ